MIVFKTLINNMCIEKELKNRTDYEYVLEEVSIYLGVYLFIYFYFFEKNAWTFLPVHPIRQLYRTKFPAKNNQFGFIFVMASV